MWLKSLISRLVGRGAVALRDAMVTTQGMSLTGVIVGIGNYHRPFFQENGNRSFAPETPKKERKKTTTSLWGNAAWRKGHGRCC